MGGGSGLSWGGGPGQVAGWGGGGRGRIASRREVVVVSVGRKVRVGLEGGSPECGQVEIEEGR